MKHTINDMQLLYAKLNLDKFDLNVYISNGKLDTEALIEDLKGMVLVLENDDEIKEWAKYEME
jgi:hypothetical protein